MSQTILVESQTSIAAALAAAGVTTITGSTIDVSNSLSAVFQVPLGTVSAGQTSTAKVQHGDQSDASDMADVSGLSYSLVDGDSNKLILLELVRPRKQYARVVITRSGGNVVLERSTVRTYKQRSQPTSAGSDVAAASSVIP